MATTIHILNGDSTLQIFKQTNIEGETLIWREVLSEGPVNIDFNSDSFWREREAYMTHKFSIEKEAYATEVRKPFEEFNNQLNGFDEVVLWFEYDLFCQINMMTLIHWLGKERAPGQTISLVCAGKMDDSGKLYGLGELSPIQLEALYAKKLKLNTREFEFATDVYAAYCSPEVDELFTFTIMPSDEFWYISDALKAHFKRFPYTTDGLTEIEQKILELASETDNQRELVGKLLRWQTYYGFGDLQYFDILNSLEVLFNDFDTLQLKTEPELSSAIENLDRSIKLGGASLKDWAYDPQSEELVKTSSGR